MCFSSRGYHVRQGLLHPVSRGSNGTPTAAGAGKDAGGAIDYVYLKNVLLQFLETPEKKHQMQLVPVLGMLLHMDKSVDPIFRAMGDLD